MDGSTVRATFTATETEKVCIVGWSVIADIYAYSLSYMEHGTFLTRYPLRTTVWLSVLHHDPPIPNPLSTTR